MASFVERTRCPACGSGAITTLLSRDFGHPSVWAFVERRYRGRVSRRELAGRRHEIARCALCKLLFQRYVLSDASLAQLYDEWAKTPRAESTDLELAAPGESRPQCVLDMGAGDGGFCATARKAGCEVIAVEVAGSRLERLRECGFVAHARIEAVAHERIDLARCHEILEHLPRPFETLDEVARRLAPGGRIEISVPDASRSSSELQRLCWSAGDDALRPLEHVNGFTPRALRAIAHRLELELVEPVARGCTPWRRPGTLRLALRSARSSRS